MAAPRDRLATLYHTIYCSATGHATFFFEETIIQMDAWPGQRRLKQDFFLLGCPNET